LEKNLIILIKNWKEKFINKLRSQMEQYNCLIGKNWRNLESMWIESNLNILRSIKLKLRKISNKILFKKFFYLFNFYSYERKFILMRSCKFFSRLYINGLYNCYDLGSFKSGLKFLLFLIPIPNSLKSNFYSLLIRNKLPPARRKHKDFILPHLVLQVNKTENTGFKGSKIED